MKYINLWIVMLFQGSQVTKFLVHWTYNDLGIVWIFLPMFLVNFFQIGRTADHSRYPQPKDIKVILLRDRTLKEATHRLTAVGDDHFNVLHLHDKLVSALSSSSSTTS